MLWNLSIHKASFQHCGSFLVNTTLLAVQLNSWQLDNRFGLAYFFMPPPQPVLTRLTLLKTTEWVCFLQATHRHSHPKINCSVKEIQFTAFAKKANVISTFLPIKLKPVQATLCHDWVSTGSAFLSPLELYKAPPEPLGGQRNVIVKQTGAWAPTLLT